MAKIIRILLLYYYALALLSHQDFAALGGAKTCKLSLKNVQRYLMYSINAAPLTILH